MNIYSKRSVIKAYMPLNFLDKLTHKSGGVEEGLMHNYFLTLLNSFSEAAGVSHFEPYGAKCDITPVRIGEISNI